MVTTSGGVGGVYPANNGITQVSLIHSSDSVRTVSTGPIYRPTSSMSSAIKKSSHTTTPAPFVPTSQRVSFLLSERLPGTNKTKKITLWRRSVLFEKKIEKKTR
ncbi:hypothetical protein B9Z55_019078 [Caenorhabditis nigoni]|uniref:Uncharacterized protein n=1 Tax=Caenorhabditis nigoni TaxID=1611254 RepID=A0A2G5TGX6_9PELO|nr:hypothetical protein B9Z55_019078 [Caenorhabditis nigoni]